MPVLGLLCGRSFPKSSERVSSQPHDAETYPHFIREETEAQEANNLPENSTTKRQRHSELNDPRGVLTQCP